MAKEMGTTACCLLVANAAGGRSCIHLHLHPREIHRRGIGGLLNEEALGDP